MIRIITSNSRFFQKYIFGGFLPFGPIVRRRKESAGGRPVTEAVLQEEAMEATSGTAAETRMAAFTTSHTAVHRLVRIGKKNLRCCSRFFLNIFLVGFCHLAQLCGAARNPQAGARWLRPSSRRRPWRPPQAPLLRPEWLLSQHHTLLYTGSWE